MRGHVLTFVRGLLPLIVWNYLLQDMSIVFDTESFAKLIPTTLDLILQYHLQTSKILVHGVMNLTELV